MSDGAQQGIMPTRALQTILGGEPAPDDGEGMSRKEMKEAIQAVDLTKFPQEYDDACMYTARLIYDFVTEDWETRRNIPSETVYDREHPDYARAMSGAGVKVPIKEAGLYDVMKEHGYVIPPGLTGFMWGWAVNAARYALAELPAPNPAIMTIVQEGQ